MRLRWMRTDPCRRTVRDLQLYLDGEADPDVAWRVSRHLSRCEDCFGDADDLRTVKDAIARLRVAPDPDAIARLRTLLVQLTDPTAGT
jgi:anti-sigma factor RsiW